MSDVIVPLANVSPEELTRREREHQGLPSKVADEVVVRRLAAILAKPRATADAGTETEEWAS